MSEKTILNRLTIVENYVRGIFQKLTKETSNLDVDSGKNIEIFTTEDSDEFTAIKNFAVSSRLSPNEVKKLVSVYPAVNLQFPETNADLSNAYVLPAAPTVTAAYYGVSSGNFKIDINNLDVAVITAATTFTMGSNLSTVSFLSLRSIFGNFSFTVTAGAGLYDFYFPELQFIEGVFTLPSLITSRATIAFPKLKVGRITNSANISVQQLLLPEVIQIDYTDIATAGTLKEINLPKAKVVTLSLTNTKSYLTDIYLPSIEWLTSTVANSLTINTTPALVNFYLGESLKGTSGNFIISICALNQASVDNILIRLAALNGTNGTIYYRQRIVTITGTSAAPSVAGLAAKALLTARGCTVTTN
jgi:hypothetical protein